MTRHKSRKDRDIEPKLTLLDIIGKILGGLILLAFMLWILEGPLIKPLALKYWGVCIKAGLTSETTRIRYHAPTLVYKFWYHGEIYDGDSHDYNLTKAGDSINVIYLPAHPSWNLRLDFFDDKSRFNCK